MRIKEIIEQQKVSQVKGDEVTIDQGDGTKLTVDTKKVPMMKDPKTGKLKMPKPGQTKQPGQAAQDGPKPGDEIEIEESDVGQLQQKFMGRVKQAAQKVPGGDASQVPQDVSAQIAQLVQDASGSAAAALAGSDEVQGGPAITKRMAQAEKQLFDMINQADPQMKAHLVAAMNSAAATGAKATPASANLSKQAPAGM